MAVVHPEWYRKSTEKTRVRYVDKHAKYLAWIRGEYGDSKSFSDDDLWEVIREAVTLKTRVAIALFSLLVMGIPTLYPVYAEALLGTNPPYWQELVLGVSGGVIFGAVLKLCGTVALRARIRQLVDVN